MDWILHAVAVAAAEVGTMEVGLVVTMEEVEEDLLSVIGLHVPRQYIQSLLLWVMDRSLYHMIFLRQFTLRRSQVFHRRQLQ